MNGIPGTMGERWIYRRDAPHPDSAAVLEARYSPPMRQEVDRMMARWVGLPDDQVEGYVEWLRVRDDYQRPSAFLGRRLGRKL